MFEVLQKEHILAMCTRAGFCRSNDKTRSHINGVLCTQGPSNFEHRYVATDGHRMMVWNEFDDPDRGVESVNIPGAVIDYMWAYRDDLQNLTIENDKDDPQTWVFKVRLHNALVTFEMDYIAAFPPYRQVIPRGFEWSASGTATDAKSALNKLKKAGVRDVKIISGGNRLYFAPVTTKELPEIEETRFEIGLLENAPAKPITIGVNLQYVLDYFRSFGRNPGADFTIRLSGCLDPIVFETGDTLYVVMPIRLD